MFNKLNDIQVNSDIDYHKFLLDSASIKIDENTDMLEYDDLSRRMNYVI